MSNRRKLGHVLPATRDSEGHNTVILEGPRGKETRRVCELVAASFLGRCPARHRVEHINGDPTDDALANLRYVPIED